MLLTFVILSATLCALSIIYWMLLKPFIVSNWPRLPRVAALFPLLRPFRTVRFSYSTHHDDTNLPVVMFKKAVQAHDGTSAPQKILKQSVLPSSSPPAPDTDHPQNAISSHAQEPRPTFRPVSDAALNSIGSPSRSANTGVKRTFSGLAKALGNNGHDLFQDSTPAIGPFPPTLDQTCSNTTQREGPANTFFDENDFDSDPDLDVQDPSTKASISYPKLPTKKHSAKPVTYPSLHTAQLHTEATRDSKDTPGALEEPPPSSLALPWSSSPVEHQQAPDGSKSLHRFTYAGPGTAKSPELQKPQQSRDNGPSEPGPRPSKRRTLPWLEEQSRKSQALSHHQSTSSSKSHSKAVPDNTPLAKNSASPYPWNTTASAIKEQQKQLRKFNKNAGRADKESDSNATVAPRRSRPSAIARPALSHEQRKVLDLIVDNKKSVFFTGSAGTGKSVLLRETITVLRQKFQKEPDRVAITASTGLAACNIGGVTLHSFSGIGLGKEDVPELVKKIKRNQKAKHRWMRTKVLIVDEISMIDADLFDKLENIARIIRNNGRPFGGIQLVVTGDFFQLPPVPDSSARESKFAFDAGTWGAAIDHTIGLHHVFRQRDPVFAGMLNEMREGHLKIDSINAFRRLSRPIEDEQFQATELFPTRGEVDNANQLRMRQLAGDVRVFHARDGGAIAEKIARDRLLGNCMAPEVLELKTGSQVMLIKNIDEMLVNGSLGKVIGFMNEERFDSYTADPENYLSTQNVPDDELNPHELKQKRQQIQKFAAANTTQVWPVVRFMLSDGSSRDLLCNRETWKIELPNGEVQASRAQVPLILAWALSIHKAQGQTLERVKVDLGKVFENGQAYVALSRATTMTGLQVLRFDPNRVTAHPKVRDFYASLSRAEQAGKGGGDGGVGDEFSF